LDVPTAILQTRAVNRPNPLLIAAAAVYVAAALPLLFAPDEILTATTGAAPTVLDTALLQLVAAALFGFAMLNWFQRTTVTGGIYGRPIVAANLSHTAVAALSLLHFAKAGTLPHFLMVPLGLYTVLALAFGWAFFRRVV